MKTIVSALVLALAVPVFAQAPEPVPGAPATSDKKSEKQKKAAKKTAKAPKKAKKTEAPK